MDINSTIESNIERFERKIICTITRAIWDHITNTCRRTNKEVYLKTACENTWYEGKEVNIDGACSSEP